ncbi:centromere protein J [Manduca sexta]|uniref:centromere protein J n=1 Tax=Manduca sexta TaxID=7130 RepID=UPI00188EFD39|nr:centromere protein J [Manduca sexta]
MDQSYSDSDLCMSPTQILERLQVLRQLQLMQRGKLQKQRLQYQETSENSSGFTEIVSHFSSSTSSNLFRSLLQSPREDPDNVSQVSNDISRKVNEQDLVEGISILNLSQESEFIIKSPNSARSHGSTKQDNLPSGQLEFARVEKKSPAKKQIELDEMPILTPKKDFEALIIEKLKNELAVPEPKHSVTENKPNTQKRTFLKRGEGMARFGLRKKDLVIQNTKSLPWKSQNFKSKMTESPKRTQIEKKDIPVTVQEPKVSPIINRNIALNRPEIKENQKSLPQENNSQKSENTSSTTPEIYLNQPNKKIIEMPKGKHPLMTNKGKTWAAVLTKEQNDFLTQLKQSDYYKNFASPAKSTISEVSCDENLSKLTQEREVAEQNMFELLENKVSHESFDLESSFFSRFFRKNNLECSGESTPLIMQKCLAANPNLLHIVSDLKQRKKNFSQSEMETCQSEYTECCSDACSSVSSCCSCQTVEHPQTPQSCIYNKKESIPKKTKLIKRKETEKEDSDKCQIDTVTENDVMKANIVEMNTKLINTSELLKERLHELEDEIETFRKENANLAKLREEIDSERQKFYEEKKEFEQKFNEEKVLSEYYLAEEREKITKQKQMYERYVREMRGKLSKKDRDEVINLKKEVENLKEEIRVKDAKSTSTIARLRNQIKIMEKEKKDMTTEIEKLKKENRRIQHSNDITRRLTNMKYLAEINKKLANVTSKESRSTVDVDSDAKYKAFEIDRQSRSKKKENTIKGAMRPRAKSVPNLKVTSRYAKYFSQKDSVSQMEQNGLVNIERLSATGASDNDEIDDLEEDKDVSISEEESIHSRINSENGEENNLEKLYMETFRSVSPKSNISNGSSIRNHSEHVGANDFFLRQSNSRSNSIRSSKSPTQELYGHNSSRSSKSPVSILSNRLSNQSPINSYRSTDHVSNLSAGSNHSHRSKSPISSNHSYSSQNLKSSTVIHNDQYRDRLLIVSPEPFSKSSLTKSNLNPTEIRKSDGSKELRFPNGNVKLISADGKYSKFIYYNGDVKENFYSEGRIKYFYAQTKTYHTTHPDGLEVLEFPDGQVEKRYKDGSTEIRLPNGSVRYFDPKNEHVREEWRFPDGATLTVSASGEQRIVFANGQVEVHASDHKRREFPDGTVKLVYNDGTSETRYASGRVRIKDKHGNLIMDSASG